MKSVEHIAGTGEKKHIKIFGQKILKKDVTRKTLGIQGKTILKCI
jgi:hypothetical protein